MRAGRRILLTLVAAMSLAAAGASAAPMVVLYASQDTNRQIVKPGTAGALPIDGRLYVQEPNVGHLFGGDADRPYRLSGVSGSALLAAGDGESMARLLRSRIDAADCHFVPWGNAGCRSHLVFVDEIDYRFAEKAPNLNTKAWAGRTSRNQPKRKFPNYIPRPRPGHAGYELARAMQILAATPYAGGGTYADRVHFYIAPGVVTSIGVGRGRYHNLGRDKRPHFRSHEGLRSALQISGGVWLEMYHFDVRSRVRYPFNTYEWSVYPWRFALYLTAPGAARPDPALMAKIHFHMTRGMPKNKGGAPAECANPATPQGCQFALASSPKNTAILANGVGQYKMEGNEAEWRFYVKRLNFPELP
jgi:hypothetical protein